MNLISLYLIYHTLALQDLDLIGVLVVYMQREDLLPHILSCHRIQSHIVTRWQIVRGSSARQLPARIGLGGGLGGSNAKH